MSQDEMQQLQAWLRRVEGKLDTTCEWINGTNDSAGAKERVRSLEESRDASSWWIKTAIGGVVASIGMALWGLITGRS
jgi:hypothetical protein